MLEISFDVVRVEVELLGVTGNSVSAVQCLNGNFSLLDLFGLSNKIAGI